MFPVNNQNFRFRYQFSEIHPGSHLGQQERPQGCLLFLSSYTGSGQGSTNVTNSKMLSLIGPERSSGSLPPSFPALSHGIKSLPSGWATQIKTNTQKTPRETAMRGPPHQLAPGHWGAGGRGSGSRKQIDRDIGHCLEYCFMGDETANHCKCLELSCCQKLCATSALIIRAIIF